MTSPRSRHGVLLVNALLVSAAIWALLVGLLVTVRLQHEIAIAARDNRVAREAARILLSRLRAHDWWGGAPLSAETGTGADGTCEWSLDVIDVTGEYAWFAAEVTFGRATVRIDGTAYPTP